MVSRSILLAGHGLLLLWSTLAQLKPMWCMHSEPVPAQPDTNCLGLRVQEAKLEHFGLTTNYITVGGHRNVLQFLHSTQTGKKKKKKKTYKTICQHLGHLYGC
jgi:hypothetical protein